MRIRGGFEAGSSGAGRAVGPAAPYIRVAGVLVGVYPGGQLVVRALHVARRGAVREAEDFQPAAASGGGGASGAASGAFPEFGRVRTGFGPGSSRVQTGFGPGWDRGRIGWLAGGAAGRRSQAGSDRI